MGIINDRKRCRDRLRGCPPATGSHIRDERERFIASQQPVTVIPPRKNKDFSKQKSPTFLQTLHIIPPLKNFVFRWIFRFRWTCAISGLMKGWSSLQVRLIWQIHWKLRFFRRIFRFRWTCDISGLINPEVPFVKDNFSGICIAQRMYNGDRFGTPLNLFSCCLDSAVCVPGEVPRWAQRDLGRRAILTKPPFGGPMFLKYVYRDADDSPESETKDYVLAAWLRSEKQKAQFHLS